MRVHGNLFVRGAFVEAVFLSQFRDEKASGTVGGTLTAGSWNTRTLNTTLTNDISGCSIAANQITLPAGTYYITAATVGHDIGGHRARLFDVTNNAILIQGPNAQNNTVDNLTTIAEVKGIITLASSKVIRLEHYITTSSSTSDAGDPTSIVGFNEVYSDIVIWKVS